MDRHENNDLVLEFPTKEKHGPSHPCWLGNNAVIFFITNTNSNSVARAACNKKEQWIPMLWLNNTILCLTYVRTSQTDFSLNKQWLLKKAALLKYKKEWFTKKKWACMLSWGTNPNMTHPWAQLNMNLTALTLTMHHCYKKKIRYVYCLNKYLAVAFDSVLA